MTALLELQGVSKKYERGNETIEALQNASFIVDEGTFITVTGPSGAGKSTLLHVAGGLDKPDEGIVLFKGEDINKKSRSEQARFRREQLGFIFQFFNLVPTLSAVENVSLPLLLDNVGRREADARATEVLKALGMGDRLGHRPTELSGGQMQRVAVGRAFVAQPALLLADEPTGNLDSRSGREVLEALSQASKERGAAVILVTHDPEAATFGDRHVVIRDGQITDT